VQPTDVVTCLCGKQFCFSCSNEYHIPISCSQLKVWDAKNEEDKDAASLKLITAIAKPCPKCGIQVDRVDGCNHMTCQKCRHEWCWQCRGAWLDHGKNTGGFYFCNKYQFSDAFKDDQDADRLREEHNRFLHYYNGFYVNKKAEDSYQTMMKAISEKANPYKDHSGGDPQFLFEALETLKRCRHILKYTYIYGYFLPIEDECCKLELEVFEAQQAMAQNFCELLANELLKPASDLERNKIVYLHKACSNYFDNLLKLFQSEEEKVLYSPRITKAHQKKSKKKKFKGATEEQQRALNRWICPKCTFSNPTTLSNCTNCQFDRTSDAVGQNAVPMF